MFRRKEYKSIFITSSNRPVLSVERVHRIGGSELHADGPLH